MTTTTGPPTPSTQQQSCWCCALEFEPEHLIALGNHPETLVCLDCADYLAIRAQERRDDLRPTVAGRVRARLRAARGFVIAHDLHNKPIIGPVLRRLGRHLF